MAMQMIQRKPDVYAFARAAGRELEALRLFTVATNRAMIAVSRPDARGIERARHALELAEEALQECPDLPELRWRDALAAIERMNNMVECAARWPHWQ